jgi:hypothetical protein
VAELKTRPNDRDVGAFLAAVPDERRRRDSLAVLELMRDLTGQAPRMWGNSIVGFGTYHYRYASGREGDWFLTGFSPRKQNLTLYIMSRFEGQEELLSRLGKHRTGKGCLYINRLGDVDETVLRKLIRRSIEHPMGGAG